MNVCELTKVVKSYDKNLYAMKGDRGKILIMREYYTPITMFVENEDVTFIKRDDYLVVPLTNNWSMNGRPTPWGSDRVLSRLREMDGWNRDVYGEMLKHNEKVEESKKRDFSNKAQDFASEYHSEFKKAFSDVRVANMNKFDRRYKDDKKIKRS